MVNNAFRIDGEVTEKRYKFLKNEIQSLCRYK